MVKKNGVAAFRLRAFFKTVGADRVQMSAPGIDSESENRVELIGWAGEIARLAFCIRHDDLALRNAADEKTLTRGVIRDALRNELRIFKSKSDGRGECLRFFVRQILAERLELSVIPHRIESGVAYGNEAEFAALQAPQQRQRSVALTKVYVEDRLIKYKHAITGTLFPQSLNPRKTCTSRNSRGVVPRLGGGQSE